MEEATVAKYKIHGDVVKEGWACLQGQGRCREGESSFKYLHHGVFSIVSPSVSGLQHTTIQDVLRFALAIER
jgi:hypothetical protein